MAITALSDISKGGTSAFAAGGGGGSTAVTDADDAVTAGNFILGSPYTNSPGNAPMSIDVAVENGRIYQRGHLYSSAFGVVSVRERYKVGAGAWSPWILPAYQNSPASFSRVAQGFTDLGAVGATLDVQIVDSAYQRATMTANCAVSFNQLWNSNGTIQTFYLELSGNFTPTFSSVTWLGGVQPPYMPGTVYTFICRKDAGGVTSILGSTEAQFTGVQSATVSAGVLDLSAITASVVTVGLSQNVTSVILPPAYAAGQRSLDIIFLQDLTGNRTVSGWPGATVFANGYRPDIASQAGAGTTITLVNVNDSKWVLYAEARSGSLPAARIPTTQRFVVGASGGTALGTLALTAARIYYIPFVPCRRMKLTQLGISVSTLVAGTGTLGIYAADGNANFDYPGTRLASTAQGAVNTGSTGTKTASINYTLEPGVLYFIAMINTSAATVRAVAVAGKDAMLGFTDNGTTVISGYYQAGSTNVLPATAAAPTVLAGASTPAIYLV